MNEFVSKELFISLVTASCTALLTWLANVYLEYKKRRKQRQMFLKAICAELECFNVQQLRSIVDFLKKGKEAKEYCYMATKRTGFPVYENNAVLIPLVGNDSLGMRIVECYNSVYAFLDFVDDINDNCDQDRKVVLEAVKPQLDRIVAGQGTMIDKHGAEIVDLIRQTLLKKHHKMIEEAVVYGRDLAVSIERTVNEIKDECDKSSLWILALLWKYYRCNKVANKIV